ncbi:MAG: (deoxy)nucleoside triphosphate pyrophosphohydrolase [Acidobacteria bacterium]|nr:(deoxy)nucleoside triphosphate pyrophosphohydrolase [Acidobacteriota bacterium]
MIVTVVAAIIRQNGRILITRRFDHVHLPGLWEFPGGKVERGEVLKVALKREILEELGVEIRVEDEFFTVEHDYPEKSVQLHFFNCTIRRGELRPIDVADMRWVEPAELVQFEFPAADAELIARIADRRS